MKAEFGKINVVFKNLSMFVLAAASALIALGCTSGSGTDVDAGADADTDTDTDSDTDTDTFEVDISLCAPENGPFSTTIDNPYLPFEVGAVNELEGLEGGTEQIKLRYTVLDETQDVDGVTTRVVQEEIWDLGSADITGVQRFYVAQAPDGTVCFFGAETTEGEGNEEEWMAGVDDALPGILMPADPAIGQVFDVVHAPPDVEPVEVTKMGETVETPAGTFTDTVTLAADESGMTVKIYAAGIGMIDDDGVLLISTTY
jgi:hypothetical protein